MVIMPTSASSTQPSYRVTYEALEAQQSLGQLADYLHPFNYGSQLISQSDSVVNFRVFID